MKESRFNIYYKAKDGKQLAFNSLSCGLAVTDDSYEQLLEKLPELKDDNVPDELKAVYEAAKQGNFIVPDDRDELVELELKRNCQKYHTGTLGLTIAPTLMCNFKCVYCYETPKPGKMTDFVQGKVVEFVDKQIKSLRQFQVNWYGGEPLMAQDVIWNLSEKFLKMSADNGVDYSAYMVSNGSLLNDDVIERMIRYKIFGIQITLDGPPEIHNARRVSRDGIGKFDVIVTNINKLLSTGKVKVALRINVDKTNEDDVEKLIRILSDRLVSKNIQVSFGHVTAYTEACKSVENTCYDNVEYAAALLKYYGLLEKYGFDEGNPFPYPQARLNYCCAEVLNSDVIDFEGYLYKCWNEVGNISRAIANVCDENLDLANQKQAEWLLRNPFGSEKCRECNLLPICMGSCPYNECVLRKESDCDAVKYNLEEVMTKYYNDFCIRKGK